MGKVVVFKVNVYVDEDDLTDEEAAFKAAKMVLYDGYDLYIDPKEDLLDVLD